MEPKVKRTVATDPAAAKVPAATSSRPADADRQRLVEVVVGATACRDANGQVLPNSPKQLIEVSLPGGVCLRLHGDVSPVAVSQLAQALGLRSQTDSSYPQLGETS
jgi:hypothetical protein